jgi:ribosome biogenesis GTPase
VQKRSRKRQPARRDEAIARLTGDARSADEAQTAGGESFAATVVWLAGIACRVRDEAGEDRMVPLPPRREPGFVAVGDAVTVAIGAGGATIAEVAPRRTFLARPDPQDARRPLVLAANVDVVVIVVSVVEPPLHPRLIDRFLVAIQLGGAEALVALNKIDRLAELDAPAREAELAKLAPYRAMGLPIVEVSTKSLAGLDALHAALRGKTCAFVGHSGVGKSSLVNAFDPALDAKIGELSVAWGGRGKHTTTASTLHVLPDGTRVIDTPGVRAVGLWSIDERGLGDYFPEIAARAGGCRFADCRHDIEPRCAVREAVASGELAAARYDAYLRILRSLREEGRGS